ncbi:MAG: SDR family NAD(P)-dependent oxidoreductase [Elusimicrobia bacterium]|nr:SDR family NAD(P)-dependent oxidoreductase [Elusimicrobiota bacterium]
MMNLKGKTVLVTGAASGIGRRLARDLFWNEGSRLILADIDAEGLEELENELEPPGEGDRVEAVVCDIALEAHVERLARAAGGGPIDVLVNNAGVARLGSFENGDFRDFERVIAVNLLGTARVTKAVLPRLLKSREPFIVNVASMAGLVGAPGMSSYVASKFAIVGLSDALHAELEGRVGVGVVCPTFVRTNIAQNAPGRAGSFLAAVGSKPAKVSTAILRTIKENKRLVLVNPDAYFFYYLHRFFPGLSETLVSAGYKMLQAAGVVEA